MVASPAARAPLSMIAAMTPSRVIGGAGAIPWHIPEDLKYFRRVTRGHAVLMGRATYASIGHPLKDRRNIVISRNRELVLPGCEVAPSLEAAIALARETDREPCVIGGAQIYAEALPLATRLFLTYLEQEVPGDAYFPPFDAAEWRETERVAGPGLVWVMLERT
jgi:dihydrofolate reductase